MIVFIEYFGGKVYFIECILNKLLSSFDLYVNLQTFRRHEFLNSFVLLHKISSFPLCLQQILYLITPLSSLSIWWEILLYWRYCNKWPSSLDLFTNLQTFWRHDCLSSFGLLHKISSFPLCLKQLLYFLTRLSSMCFLGNFLFIDCILYKLPSSLDLRSEYSDILKLWMA